LGEHRPQRVQQRRIVARDEHLRLLDGVEAQQRRLDQHDGEHQHRQQQRRPDEGLAQNLLTDVQLQNGEESTTHAASPCACASCASTPATAPPVWLRKMSCSDMSLASNLWMRTPLASKSCSRRWLSSRLATSMPDELPKSCTLRT